MVDGKFSVEKGSNFSLAVYKELGLTKDQGNKIWGDIFSIAKSENFGDVNKVHAGQEFEFSNEGLDRLIKIVKEKLGVTITKSDKEEVAKNGNNTPEVRSHEEIKQTTNLYLQADNALDRLKALDMTKQDGSWALNNLTNNITKENLAYILKKDPEFFNKLEKKIGEDTTKEVLKTLMEKFGKHLPTPQDPQKATKDDFMAIMMSVAKENPAKEEVSETDKQARKDEDKKLQDKQLEETREKRITQDKKELNLNLNISSKTTARVDVAKKAAGNIKDKFIENPQEYLKQDARTLAYLLHSNNETKKAVMEKLSLADKRTLLAKLGYKGADKLNVTNVDAALDKAVTTFVNNDSAVQKNEQNPKIAEMINNATNLLAEFKNLSPKDKGEYENKWGGKTYYNKKTGKCVIIKKDGNNITSIEVGRSFNPQTKTYVPETKFEKGQIKVNADGKGANYEQIVMPKDSKYFDKLKDYIKEKEKFNLNINQGTPASQTAAHVDVAKKAAGNIKDKFIKNPKEYLNQDARTLAYLLHNNNDTKKAVMEKLSLADKRTLLAKLGYKGADKLNVTNVDAALDKALTTFVNNDSTKQKSEQNPKIVKMINNATNILAEFKNLPPEDRGEYENKWGGKTYYNKITGKCVIIKKDANNITSIEVGRSFNPKTKTYVPETKFEKGQIKVNADGKGANYEQILKPTTDKDYFKRLQKYAKEF